MFPFNILIHEMLADDHGEGVHNHISTLLLFYEVDIGNFKEWKILRALDILDLDQQQSTSC